MVIVKWTAKVLISTVYPSIIKIPVDLHDRSKRFEFTLWVSGPHTSPADQGTFNEYKRNDS